MAQETHGDTVSFQVLLLYIVVAIEKVCFPILMIEDSLASFKIVLPPLPYMSVCDVLIQRLLVFITRRTVFTLE